MNNREKRKSFLKSLDAFPKVESELTATTETGGIVSLVVMVIMAFLLLSELYEWRRLRYDYEFLVDQHGGTGEMDVNIDVTVAMDCKFLRIDALDAVGATLGIDKKLRTKGVTYHTIGVEGFDSHIDSFKLKADTHDPQWGSTWGNNNEKTNGPLNGCHVSGSFSAHRVQGTFMITAFGHGYLGPHTPHEAINFTHRIDELSFGKRYPGLINPLHKTHLVAKTNFDNFQYFLGLVPTIYVDKTVSLWGGVMVTNQYSVTEFSHTIDPKKPDALPGIFIKYDFEPLSVRVSQSRRGTLEFLTRTFGVVGGVFATSGVILRMYLNVTKMMQKQPGGYQKL